MNSGETQKPNDDLEEILLADGQDSISPMTRLLGCLEEAAVSPKFESLKADFVSRHSDLFPTGDENPHQALVAFKDWQAKVESFLTGQCGDVNFKAASQEADAFSAEERGDLDELLASLFDFNAFKSMIRAETNKGALDLSSSITTRSFQTFSS